MNHHSLSDSERAALAEIGAEAKSPPRFWLLRAQIAMTMGLAWIALMVFRVDWVLLWIGADPLNSQEMLSTLELRTISMITLGGIFYLCLWFAKDLKLVLGVLLIVSCSNLLLDSYVLYLDSILVLSPRPIVSILARGVFIAIIYSLYKDAHAAPPPPRAIFRNPFES